MGTPWELLRDQREKVRKQMLEGPDIAKCPSCECRFFEIMEVQQVKLENIALGAKIPPGGPYSVYLARCLKCGEISAPLIDTLNRPQKELDTYNACLDIVDELNKNRKA